MKDTTQLAPRDSQISALDRPVESQGTPHSYNYGVDPNAENEINLLDYWRAIRKRIWLVIGFVVLITMLATVYMARKPDVYQAEARVQVDLENNAAVLGKTPYFVGTPNDPVYFNTQLQILTSGGLLRQVVKSLDLEHNPDFLKGQTKKRSVWETVLNMAGFKRAKEEPLITQNDGLTLATTASQISGPEDLQEAKRLSPYVTLISAGLKAEPVRENRAGYNKETRLIDLTFTHGDPVVAAKVVNTIAQIFCEQNLEKKDKTNSSTGNFLVSRIAELQSRIREDEEKLVNYAKNHQIISLDEKQNTVVERLAGLNRQLLEAENDRKTAESQLKAARTPGAATALVAEADSKQSLDDQAKLNDLKQKRAQLLVDATEEAPEVKEINQQIAELEKQLSEGKTAKTSNLLTNLDTRYRQALAKEESLRTAFNQQQSETLSQNEAAITYHIIQQEIDTNKSLLTNLLQRSKENDVTAANNANNISVVDYAIAPEGPVGPNRVRGVIMAFLASLVLGIGLALFLEYLDDTVHSTDEIERLLHLPALAVIPAVSAGSRRKAISPVAGALQKGNGSASDNAELLMNVDGRSALAEAYRHLRTSVLLSTAGRAPRALLVTSSLPGEGKTTTAVNTAVSLAQTGASVCLIDADMRRPRLRGIFGLNGGAGLSSILSSEMNEPEMLGLPVEVTVSGLSVLTSGPIPPNPAELLGSEQMRRLIHALQAKYNHVVVDSPPITSFTDGVLISTMVDGVLLVVHGGKSSRNVVRRSKQLLNDVGAKIFGVVLNNVDARSQDYYYYKQQNYYQSYYQTDDQEQKTALGA